IAANIATVPRLLGWDNARIRGRVDELIELVGLDDDMRDRYPSELSGGQRQRVGVARALAADPLVLLMDEPFGAVDPIVRGRLQQELLKIQQTLHKTIVIVTHDIDEAILLGDRIAILEIGGRLAQYATPAEILANPASDFVADFLGEERGLKRLSLIELRMLDIPPGPVVERTDTAATARRTMSDHRTDWVGILDGRRLLGWAWERDLPVSGPIDGVSPREFRATLPSTATLRQAVDAVVRDHNQVAVVIDGDRYVGMLFVDQIAQELQR
ncbi:MAG TPA: ATP-binding cassette domain-containing protein, partial [Nitriliruptorales bacterium]